MWQKITKNSLSSLNDVNLQSPPLDGQVLTYDSPTEKFVPRNVPVLSGDGTISPWSGKKWLVIGDSITNYNKAPGSYHAVIAQKLNMTAINEGRGGWGYFNSNFGNYYTRIDGNQIDLTADLVTIWLGTNDWFQSNMTTPLTPENFGVFGDTDKTESFYGAVDYTLKQLAIKFIGKPVAVFTPLQRSNSFPNIPNPHGITLEQVSDAIIQVAQKYTMPVFDLYREANFAVFDNSFDNDYFSDGLHPNDSGHAILARKIEAFINSL